jgi:hypothetical protein
MLWIKHLVVRDRAISHASLYLEQWENHELSERMREAARKRVLSYEGELRNLAFNSRRVTVQSAARELINRLERMRDKTAQCP